MYKIKRFSKLSEKRMSLNPRNSWSSNNDMNNLPEGVIRHPNSKYSKYNAVWENPDVKGRVIMSFILDEEFNKRFINDISTIKKKHPIRYSRLIECIELLRKGKFVFEDNDRKTKENINNENNYKYYNWDTNTHWLKRYSTKDYLMYSKDIDNGLRLTYKIYKPELINSRWKCMIKLDRCNSHIVGNESYGNGRVTIGDIFRDKGEGKIGIMYQ